MTSLVGMLGFLQAGSNTGGVPCCCQRWWFPCNLLHVLLEAAEIFMGAAEQR